MARPTGRPLRDELVRAARPHIQRSGVGGFSYGDLAKELEIRSPSIHHHFPTKADLIAEVTATYRSDFSARVADIEASGAIARLQAYIELFDETAAAGLLCLCGAIASEWPDITEPPRREVRAFFADQQRWLENEIAAGIANDELRSDVRPEEGALVVVAALEGAVLMARPTATSDLVVRVGAVLTAVLAKP